MMTARLSAPRPGTVFGALVLLFAVVAAWPWLFPPVPSVRKLATPPASAEPRRLAAPQPLAHYAAIVERPLFSPSRRPAPGSSTTVSPSADTHYRLVGVIASGARKKALIVDGARRVEVGEGEALDSWTVKKIGQNNVELTSPTGEAILKLKPSMMEPPKPQ